MTTCGNNYISINGVRKCGHIDIVPVMDPDYDGEFLKYVALAGPGESIELELKTDGGNFYIQLPIYTGTVPPCFGPSCARAMMSAPKGPHPYYSDAEIESFLKKF